MTRIARPVNAELTNSLLARALFGRAFIDCPEDVLDRVFAASTLRNYETGEYVVRRNMESANFQLVVSGELESSVTYASGHRHLFGFLRQGDSSGVAFLVSGGKHLFDHIARVNTTLLLTPNSALLKEMQGQPALCLSLLRQLSTRTEVKYAQVTLDPSVPLATRLAWAIQTLGRLHGHRRGDSIVLDMKLSQSDIADWLGVSRQHLNPHLKQLEKNGVISLGRASLIILDPDQLSTLASN